MNNLTETGRRIIDDIAARYHVSADAAHSLLISVNSGFGTQAQFDHPELGGMGQWSRGGMIMIGDMFNNALKASVEGMCNELSDALAREQMFRKVATRPTGSFQSQTQGAGGVSFSISGSASDWPTQLGVPSSIGSQNNLSYAIFPSTHRLAIRHNGTLDIYDTADHEISGFSQQQGGDQTITFTSQYGLVSVSSLKKIELEENGPADEETENVMPELASIAELSVPLTPEPQVGANVTEPTIRTAQVQATTDTEQIFATLERLAELYERGVLTDEEFKDKKTELLSRL